MRTTAMTFLLAATALPALAQDARIQSGEHETFSRLVVYMPREAEYDIEAAEGSFAISFDAPFGFDTSEVFYYIPRDRIADSRNQCGAA